MSTKSKGAQNKNLLLIILFEPFWMYVGLYCRDYSYWVFSILFPQRFLLGFTPQTRVKSIWKDRIRTTIISIYDCFHRMSLARDLELVKSLTQYPITHQPFKMRRRTLTLLKRLKRQISARSWECFSPVSRTSLVSFSSFGWRGLWALAAPLRGSLLYFFVAAL